VVVVRLALVSTCMGARHTVPSLFVWICCMLAITDWYMETGTEITLLTETG